MKKNLGILGIFLVVFIATALGSENFFTAYNLFNLTERASLYGIIGIGVAFVIITGGIDLSIGSLIGLVGVTFPFLVIDHGWNLFVGLAAIAFIAVWAGLFHGMLITKLNLQPFVVTLCALMIYRGIARWVVGDKTMGFGHDEFAGLRVLVGSLSQVPGFENMAWAKHIPVAFLLLIGLGIVAAIFLNRTIYGRYLLALGNNEQAARFSGINTTRMIIMAYVICAAFTGFGGMLFALDSGSIQPDNFGAFYELYAIAAAVLGGCSLRGGQGSIFGVLLGAAILPLIRNSINILGMDTTLEFAIIGFVILIGVIADELVKRIAARRRAIQQAKQASS